MCLCSDDYVRAYKCHLSLAEQFKSIGDGWLADHFCRRCLTLGAMVKDDGGVIEAESHCNMGLSLEQAGTDFVVNFSTII